MVHVNSHYGRYERTAAFVFFLAFSILLFGRGLAGHLTTAYIGRAADPPIYMWFMRWWRYALDHRVNPFLTDLLWAPLGFNLAWSAFIPLPAWIAIPIGRWFGETAAYNILCLVALPLATLSAFLLCRRVTGAFWPSILGGYIFGFSPYMLGQMLGGHLNLIFAFPVPLAALAGLRRLDGEISARRFTLEIAALLIVQFLCGIELFATMTVFGGFTLLIAIVFFGGEARTRLFGLIGPLAAAYAIWMIVVSPYLYYLFALGFPHDLISSGYFSGDLLNFLIPTETNLLGTFGFARAITGTFGGGHLRERSLHRNPAAHRDRDIPASHVAHIGGQVPDCDARTHYRRFVGARAARGGTSGVSDAVGDCRPVAGDLDRAAGALHDVRVPDLGVMIAMWFATSTARRLTKCVAAAADPGVNRAESACVVLGQHARHPRVLHRPNIRK